MDNMFRPGMGTENAMLFINAIIRSTRPSSLLEIGAGDSTIKICDSIISSVKDFGSR